MIGAIAPAASHQRHGRRCHLRHPTRPDASLSADGHLQPSQCDDSRAIYATTLAALLVCAILPALFLGGLLKTEFTWVVGGLFFGATGALVIGLGDFLREVHLATRTVRFTGQSFSVQRPTEPAHPITGQRG
ncbi:MAG: DUF2721 domain-containing protein [Cyanobacteria bacterium]|nr:DUF2721 domain-containing protein [Cyanobacteriota bacterium]